MAYDRGLRMLRREFCFESAEEALPFVALLCRRTEPGTAVAVALDNRRRICDLHVVTDGADHLADVVRYAGLCGDRRGVSLFLVTDRSHEALADRPDDELLWQELVDLARRQGMVLLDWWVTWGTKAFSIAEFAPTPAQW